MERFSVTTPGQEREGSYPSVGRRIAELVTL